MTQKTDFSGCYKLSGGLDGNAQKVRIEYNGDVYIVKFGDILKDNPKFPLMGSYNHLPIAEHVGCKVAHASGLPVQETLLGTYKGREVVACKDFITPLGRGFNLLSYNSLEIELIPPRRRGKTPRLSNINYVFDTHDFFDGARDVAKERYWDTMVLDAIIGNNDRHSGNWGYITHETPSPGGNAANKFLSLAPIYDCGSSLAAWIDEHEMPKITHDLQALKERALGYPAACLVIMGDRRIFYKDLLTSEAGAQARESLIKLSPKIQSLNIDAILDAVTEISDVRRDFYKATLHSRIEHILQPAYELACKERGLECGSILPKAPTLSTRQKAQCVTIGRLNAEAHLSFRHSLLQIFLSKQDIAKVGNSETLPEDVQQALAVNVAAHAAAIRGNEAHYFDVFWKEQFNVGRKSAHDVLGSVLFERIECQQKEVVSLLQEQLTAPTGTKKSLVDSKASEHSKNMRDALQTMNPIIPFKEFHGRYMEPADLGRQKPQVSPTPASSSKPQPPKNNNTSAPGLGCSS